VGIHGTKGTISIKDSASDSDIVDGIFSSSGAAAR